MLLAIVVIIVVVLFLVTPLSDLIRQAAVSGTATPSANLTPINHPRGFPFVQGNRIIDGSGHPLILRGGQIEGVFNVATPDVAGQLTIEKYPSSVKVMSQQWHMNVVRLPTCNWLWQANPANYMSRLQAAVQQANAAGLYVVIEAHDDHRCQPPYDP